MIAWNHTEPRLSSNDLIHFTGKGYQVSADQFLQALDDAAPKLSRNDNKKSISDCGKK